LRAQLRNCVEVGRGKREDPSEGQKKSGLALFELKQRRKNKQKRVKEVRKQKKGSQFPQWKGKKGKKIPGVKKWDIKARRRETGNSTWKARFGDREKNLGHAGSPNGRGGGTA